MLKPTDEQIEAAAKEMYMSGADLAPRVREDCGVDEDYCEFKAVRCVIFATAMSVPMWAVGFFAFVYFMRGGGGVMN